MLAGFNPLLLDLNLAAAQSGVHRAEHAASAMLWDAVLKERIVDDTNVVGQSCLPIAGKFRSCECPGLLKRFCPGQQVRREPTSRDIDPVEVHARPTIAKQTSWPPVWGTASCLRMRMSPSKRRGSKSQSLGSWNAGELPRVVGVENAIGARPDSMSAPYSSGT